MCVPSAALQELVPNADTATVAENNEYPDINVFYRPAMSFIIESHNLAHLRDTMKQAVRKAACRSYALQVRPDNGTDLYNLFMSRTFCFPAAGSHLVTARSVSSIVFARPVVVVRDRVVGDRSPRRGQRFHRAPMPTSSERLVLCRGIRQPSAASVLRVLADRLRSDALLATRVRPPDDGRPLLGHKLYGCRSHVFTQVNRLSFTAKYLSVLYIYI